MLKASYQNKRLKSQIVSERPDRTILVIYNIKTTHLLYLLNLASKHFHFGRTKASLTVPSEIKNKI